MKQYLRNKIDGEILHYDVRLVKHPKLEIVSEEEAFPEKFASAAVLARKNTHSKIDMRVPKEVMEPPTYTPPELAADAARRFGDNVGIPKKETKLSIPTDIVGLMETI